MPKTPTTLADRISVSERQKPVDASLATDQRVLARITDGIYRQPSSALRELISNAYDADATEVIISTDAPRFNQISVRDDGLGLSPKALAHLVEHIGGSPKRTEEGKDLGVTAEQNENLSPGGRQLIGKLGIGLFSVVQFTHHFLIITKVKGDSHRTIADITLGQEASQQKRRTDNARHDIETGHARIWREPALDKNSQGTEIKLLELLPRTRAELASDDLWTRIDIEQAEGELNATAPPSWHIGRMKPRQNEILELQPQLPWTEEDGPRTRFEKLVKVVRGAAETGSETVDLDILFDRYLQTVWILSLCAPLQYVEEHPFDIPAGGEFLFFKLENRLRGQAEPLPLKKDETPRHYLNLKAPNGAGKPSFVVIMDGVELLRPIIYSDLPKTKSAVNQPMLFLGCDTQRFAKKPESLSGGILDFEAYLFWAPRIIPKQHQGVMLRVGNASGALFDRTFMGYQVSEQTRTRQITAEIFVRKGLDDAINIDRESFNYAHPHYQYLVKWLHSALRQLANRHKDIGKRTRSEKLTKEGKRVREQIEDRVESALKGRGVEDIPDVVLLEQAKQSDVRQLRRQGTIALRKEAVVPPSSAKLTVAEQQRRQLAEKKAIAIVQLLHGWGLLENLSYEDQENLIGAIIDIVLVEG
jgi:Histidine kinase-, DNA gyrase B-, and HSP90-like ATPase